MSEPRSSPSYFPRVDESAACRGQHTRCSRRGPHIDFVPGTLFLKQGSFAQDCPVLPMTRSPHCAALAVGQHPGAPGA